VVATLTIYTLRAMGTLFMPRRTPDARTQQGSTVRPDSIDRTEPQSVPADRYELTLIPAPGWKIVPMVLLAFLAGGNRWAGYTYGGRKAHIIERSSSATVRSFTEPWITDGGTDFSAMLHSYRTKSLERFESVWLAGAMIDRPME
jgi:hypothetical protein